MSVFPGAHAFVSSPNNTSGRLVKPFVLGTIHITGNPGLPGPDAEANLTTRAGWNASATFFVGRDGRVVQRLHPEYQVPWTNGSYNRPNWNLWSVAQAIRGGYGANDAVFLTIENVGYPDWATLTSAQIEANAQIMAWGSRISGLPIDRARIWGHRDVNSVDRWCCPTCGVLDVLIGLIVARATRIGGVPDTSVPGTNYFLEGLGYVRTFRVRTGQRVVVRAGKPLRDRASWSQGKTLVSVARDTPLHLWAAVRGEQVPGAPDSDWYVAPATWSDTNHIVYVPKADCY